MTDQYVSLVRVGFFSFLGYEQKLVKQEESSLVFGSLQTKRSFENQLTVADQIRALPVGQQALDFLQKAQKYRESGELYNKKNMGVKNKHLTYHT